MSKAVSTDLTFVEYHPGCGCGPGVQGQPGQPPQVTPVQNTAVTPGYEPVDKSGRCGCCSSYYRSVWDRLCYQLFGYIPAGMDTEQILRGLVIWKDDVVLVDGNLPATFQVTATGQRKPLSTDIIYYKEHFYNIGGVTVGASDVYTCTECLPIEASVIEVYKTLVATNSRLEANEIVRRDRANQDHDRADADHDIASADHQQYGDDHFTAGQDHAGYEADHVRAASDHLAASGDRSRAADDHAVAQADHSTAQDDHYRADNDHLRADGDHARAEQDHQAAAKAVLFTPQTLTEEEQAQARENIGVEGTGTDTEAVHYTPQSLTAEQKAQARTNIGAIGAQDAEVVSNKSQSVETDKTSTSKYPSTKAVADFVAGKAFVAEYGVTPYADVLAAINAGDKIVVCRYGSILYPYSNKTNTEIVFSYQTDRGSSDVIVSSGGWVEGGSYHMYVLNTNNETAQTPLSNEDIRGFVNFHKISKTGSYNDLLNKPDLSQFITKSVNDLVNYYLKSEVYTKDEVAALIGAIQQFHYEIAASTSAVSDPQSNVLYLIGPSGTGSDKYEEYVYSNGWVKIGDTSIDLSGYVTTEALNTALAGYVTSGALETALAGKQDKIDDLQTIREGAAAGATAYQKPSSGIPASDIASGVIPAAPVNADWNASSGLAQILNKPTYAGSPTAGGFANKAVAIPSGEVIAGSTDTNILATVDNFPTTLTDGVCAYIRNNVVASASGFTLNINGTGEKPVYQTLADASRVSTVFNANSTYLFVYNSKRVEGGCWDLYYGYNSNDNTVGYNLRTNGASAPPAAQKYYRYRLLFTAANGLSLVPANTSSSTSATAAKTVNQTKIDPFGVIFYYSYTSAVNAAASPNASYLWMQYNGIALGYSFNRTGEALEMTARDPVYLKCAPQSDGSAIIDADNPFVQALPTTADGKIYIFLGFAESATALTLYYWHPVYYNDGAGIKLWTGNTDESITNTEIDNIMAA